jgi:hypothetical protein
MLKHNAPSAPSAESKDDRKKKQDDLKEKFKQKLKEDKQSLYQKIVELEKQLNNDAQN